MMHIFAPSWVGLLEAHYSLRPFLALVVPHTTAGGRIGAHPSLCTLRALVVVGRVRLPEAQKRADGAIRLHEVPHAASLMEPGPGPTLPDGAWAWAWPSAAFERRLGAAGVTPKHPQARGGRQVTSPGPGSSGARGTRPVPAGEGRRGPGRRGRIARPRRWQCAPAAPVADHSADPRLTLQKAARGSAGRGTRPCTGRSGRPRPRVRST
eukprot:scaffold96676_cov71-Phaeocystis_antarctica.AAC.2